MGAVQPLALAGFIQPDAQNHRLCHLCLRNRLVQIGLVRLAAALVAGTVTHHVQPGLFHGIFQAVHAGRVHHAGACPLIPGRDGKITDERHLDAVFQRQQIALVFQQYDALGCRPACQFVM